MLFQLIEFVIITSFDLNNKKKQTKQDENKQNKKQNTIFCKEIHLLQVRILPKNKIAKKKSKIYTVKIVLAKVYTVSIFVEFAGTSHQRINILRELSSLAKELRSASLLLKRIVNPFAKAISSKYIANL